MSINPLGNGKKQENVYMLDFMLRRKYYKHISFSSFVEYLIRKATEGKQPSHKGLDRLHM